MRILLADDEPGILQLLKDILANQNYDVVTAQNGEEAIGILDKGGVDMAILDINMPKKTGIDVLIHIRETSVNFPVILLTIQVAVEDQIKGYQAQADYYLPKPFEPGVLLAYVRAAQKRIQPN
jgi:DNA-binding response OmpR family regulator